MKGGRNSKRKAQTTMIFIYMAAIVVMGLTLLVGYSWIKGIGEQAEEVTNIKFKAEIQSFFKTVSSNYGRISTKTFDVGSKYDEVCFVSLAYYEGVSGLNVSFFPTTQIFSESGSTTIEAEYPLIADSVESGVKQNLFLVNGIDIEGMYVGSIRVDNDCRYNEPGDQKETNDDHSFLCAPVVQGRAKIKLFGRGKHVFVSLPPKKCLPGQVNCENVC